MKKIFLSLLLTVFTFAGITHVTTISKKITKNSIVFTYDVPDNNFNDIKSQPKFYKKLLTNIVCKNKNAKFLLNNMNIVYNYKKHSNNQKEVVITIKKGSCK